MTVATDSLVVDGLTLEHSGQGALVQDMSVTVDAGTITALVGESGSGKTLTALAIMGLLPVGITCTDGKIVVAGTDWLACTPRQRADMRGSRGGDGLSRTNDGLGPSDADRSPTH